MRPPQPPHAAEASGLLSLLASSGIRPPQPHHAAEASGLLSLLASSGEMLLV